MTEQQADERLWTTGRIEAFSDGVMAIAITLLVLDLRVPTPEESTAAGGLVSFLAHQWPTYVAYLAAFLSIGVIWLNHHALIDVIARFDRRLHWLNLMLLLGVATLPFPTALMADYVATGSPDAGVATAVYGLLALIMALPWTLIWRHLRDRPELMEPGFEPWAETGIRRNIGGPLIYGAAAAVALFAPLIALALYVGIVIYFASIRQPALTLAGHENADRGDKDRNAPGESKEPTVAA